MKKELRKFLLEKRDGIKSDKKRKKEAAIRKRLYASAVFRKAKSILFYASFRSEVDTMRCIENAISKSKNIVLPRVVKEEKRLKLYTIKSLNDLKPGCWGILEPDTSKCREVTLNKIDAIIVPGAGFDAVGNRLGYGAGYYDKLLSEPKSRGIKIALLFEEQLVKNIHSEKHDVKMDKIITEKRTIDCRKSKGPKIQRAKGRVKASLEPSTP